MDASGSCFDSSRQSPCMTLLRLYGPILSCVGTVHSRDSFFLYSISSYQGVSRPQRLPHACLRFLGVARARLPRRGHGGLRQCGRAVRRHPRARRSPPTQTRPRAGVREPDRGALLPARQSRGHRIREVAGVAAPPAGVLLRRVQRRYDNEPRH